MLQNHPDRAFAHLGRVPRRCLFLYLAFRFQVFHDPILSRVEVSGKTGATQLVVLACSATKLAHAAPAIELYRGSTYRANVRGETAPAVMIFSARHGFVCPDTVIEPYEQCMTDARAEAWLREIASAMPAAWPVSARTILLAEGEITGG